MLVTDCYFLFTKSVLKTWIIYIKQAPLCFLDPQMCLSPHKSSQPTYLPRSCTTNLKSKSAHLFVNVQHCSRRSCKGIKGFTEPKVQSVRCVKHVTHFYTTCRKKMEPNVCVVNLFLQFSFFVCINMQCVLLL